jgi:hypothetical protein
MYRGKYTTRVAALSVTGNRVLTSVWTSLCEKTTVRLRTKSLEQNASHGNSCLVSEGITAFHGFTT